MDAATPGHPRVDVAVVGLIGRDLVLTVEAVPGAGGSAPVTTRQELLGGAVNQAVACRQLGHTAAAVGVVGADPAGEMALAEAARDGIDVSAVSRRPGAQTALFVDVVAADGTRRLLEHVPDDAYLTADDVAAAGDLLGAARAVLIQLQQPTPVVVGALEAAHGGLVVVDGYPEDDDARAAVLAHATLVRADAGEAEALVGAPVTDVGSARAAACDLLARGPQFVALALGDAGNLVAWRGGEVVVPLLGGAPVDPTGGGDAFLAGMVAALLRGEPPATAARWGSAAAALTVATVGGRPALTADAVARLAADAPAD